MLALFLFQYLPVFFFLFYFILISSPSSGSVALHDDVTSSDPCEPGASLRFHGDGPDEPTEHTGQHGQRGATSRQPPC